MNDSEEKEILNNEPLNEPESVTREINLDELYDGAINNTVVIDPVTNNEVLLPNKKPNYKLIGVVFAIIVLLVLYYVNNKTDIGRTVKDVAPKVTTVHITTKKEEKTGILTCTYIAKSDAEKQNVTYTLNYENNALIKSEFNYAVVSNVDDSTSAIIEDLKNQYETFYINNASSVANKINFEKNDKGFTFKIETDYKNSDYDKININEGQTVLYVKPSMGDSYESLQNAYTEKGFTCNISNN